MADDRTRKQFVGDMLRSGKVPEKVELIVQDNTGQWDFSGAVLYYDSDYTASASVEYDGTSFNISNYKLNVDETVGAGQDNYILTYDHSTGLIGLEVNTGAAGGLALNDITDVTITSATTGDILRYNGSAWVDYPDSNYAAASHTHVEADITDLGAYLENVVEDTTPELGGDLGLNGSDITGSGNVNITGYEIVTGDLSLALTGTVSVTASTATVTGVGTLFFTEAGPGTAISIGGEVFTVIAVASNTSLTLDSNHVAGASGVTAYTDNPMLVLNTGNNEMALQVTDTGLWFHSEQGNGAMYLDSVDWDKSSYFGIANDGTGGGSYNYLEFKVVGANVTSQPYYAGGSVIGFIPSVGDLFIGNYVADQRWMKFELDTNKYVNVQDGTRLRIWDDTEADVATHYHDGTDYRIDLDNNTTRFRIGSSQFPVVQVDGTDYAEVCTDITTATNNYSVLTAYYSADGAQSVQLGHSGSTAAYEPGKGWLWTNTGELVYDAAIHSFKKEGAAAPVVRIYDADDSNFTTLSNDGADLDITGDGAGNINVTEIQQVQIVSNGGTYDPTYTGFYAQNGHTTGLAYMGVSNTQSGGYVEFGAAGATRPGMVSTTDAYIYFASANNDANVFHVVGDAGAYMDMWQSGGEKILEIADGTKLRIEDGGETDQADIYHDGTDLRVEGGSNTRLLYYDFTSSGYGGIYARNVSQVGYSVLSVESSTAGADFRYAELGSTGSAGIGGNHVDMSYLYYSSSSSTPDYPYFYFFNDYGDCLRFYDNLTFNAVDVISDSGNNPTKLRIFDSSGADHVDHYHDGSALQTDFTGTDNWAINGNVTLDGPVTTSDYGTGGRVKDGLDTARPVGFNVMPVYEIDTSDSFDLAHNGMIWHKGAGTFSTLTCDNDTTIPQGATYVVHNESANNLTIAEGTGVTIHRLASGSVPATGNVVVEQGGIVTVYKYSDTEWWVWGDAGALPSASLENLSDVSITAATTGDLLRYNGTNWVDYPDSNYAAASHTHVEADITDLGNYGEIDQTVAVTGTWTLDGAVTTSDYGTGGRVKDGTDTERPVGFNVMPVYEIDTNDTFDLAHNGMVWHRDAAAAVTYTIANDATIPQGATYVIVNDNTNNTMTISAGAITLRWFFGTGAPSTGNRTLAYGGVATLYKYSDTEFWIWGQGIS